MGRYDDDYDRGWPRYVPVAERMRNAERLAAALKKAGRMPAPVVVEGRAIATTFWGKAWCTNLERYSDYASRLPRGRSYVRNRAIVDLRLGAGTIAAQVVGSDVYEIAITVAPLAARQWDAICRDCAGSVASLVELLRGNLATSVMQRVCRVPDGLFPAPKEIKLSCSCPDGARMCKHVAAALYGVGARLDQQPELLFALRGVDAGALIAGAARDLSFAATPPPAARLLDASDVAALFGLDLATPAATAPGPPEAPAAPPRLRPHKIKAPKVAPRKAKPGGRGSSSTTPRRTG